MSQTERSVAVKGKKIFYREEGDAHAPTVLLIHGNTASSLWFERVMNLAGLHTIAPDMPNFGNSAHIEASDIDVYAEYLAGFVSAVVRSERFLVVGHSLGGAVAMSLALDMASRVAGLMLIDSCAPDGLATPEEYYPVIEQYKSDRNLLKSALATVTPHLTDQSVLEALVDEASRMNPQSFAGNARALARFNCESRTAELTVPVLVVRGEDDILITDEMARRTTDAFVKGTLKTLPGVGHSVMVEDPPRFIELLEGFAKQVMG